MGGYTKSHFFYREKDKWDNIHLFFLIVLTNSQMREKNQTDRSNTRQFSLFLFNKLLF